MAEVEYIGERGLLEGELTAFLAPGRVELLSVLPTLDWAASMSREGRTVVSGFSSRLERDVWDVLARGHSPIVKVVVTSRYKVVPTVYRPLLEQGRLLLVCLGWGARLDRRLAARRNAYVARLAGEVVFPSMHEGSSLWPLYLSLPSATVLSF